MSKPSPRPPHSARDPRQQFTLFLQSRFPTQIRWLASRFSPEGHLGLHLTIGALALIAMAWLFGSIAEDVVMGDPIVLLDQNVAEWFHQHGTPGYFRAMFVITFFGSAVWIITATSLGAALLIWKRGWYRLLILILAVPGGGLLNMLLKSAFHRQRPILEHPLVVLNSYSFPSGHTMGATLLYGLAAVFAFRWMTTWRGKIWLIIAASIIVFLIGLSRVALGAHFLSDVLAAAAAGLAWLALCVTSVETLRRQRVTRSGR